MLNPEIAQKNVTLHILKTFGIHTSKRLGQNFLVDTAVVKAIVQAADISATDTVLEIGPGIGTLTQGLAQTGAAVIAVELDRHLIDVLAKTLEGYDNVRVIHGDILKLNISQEITATYYKVVANLPYYITTPIIMGLLEQRLPIDLLVTMVQKEVAWRMVAAPGGKDYGSLSVAVQYYTEPEINFTVPRQPLFHRRLWNQPSFAPGAAGTAGRGKRAKEVLSSCPGGVCPAPENLGKWIKSSWNC